VQPTEDSRGRTFPGVSMPTCVHWLDALRSATPEMKASLREGLELYTRMLAEAEVAVDALPAASPILALMRELSESDEEKMVARAVVRAAGNEGAIYQVSQKLRSLVPARTVGDRTGASFWSISAPLVLEMAKLLAEGATPVQLRGCLGKLGRLSALQVAAIALHVGATGNEEAKRVANAVLCRILADEALCGQLVEEIAGAPHDAVNGDGILGAGTTRLLSHIIVQLCEDALNATTDEARKVIAAVGDLWYYKHLASTEWVPEVNEKVTQKVSVPTAAGMPVPLEGMAFVIAEPVSWLENLGITLSISDLTVDEVGAALERIMARAERLGMRATTRYGYPVCLVPAAKAPKRHRLGPLGFAEVSAGAVINMLMGEDTAPDEHSVLAEIRAHPKADLMLATLLSVGSLSHAQVLLAGDGEPVANRIAGSNVVPFMDTHGNEQPVFPNDSVESQVVVEKKVASTEEKLERLLRQSGVPQCVFEPQGAKVYATGGANPDLLNRVREHPDFRVVMVRLDGAVEEIVDNSQCAVCMQRAASKGAICGTRACTMRLCAGCSERIFESRDPRCPGCRRRPASAAAAVAVAPSTAESVPAAESPAKQQPAITVSSYRVWEDYEYESHSILTMDGTEYDRRIATGGAQREDSCDVRLGQYVLVKWL
jgi:hypothetical protein